MIAATRQHGAVATPDSLQPITGVYDVSAQNRQISLQFLRLCEAVDINHLMTAIDRACAGSGVQSAGNRQIRVQASRSLPAGQARNQMVRSPSLLDMPALAARFGTEHHDNPPGQGGQ